MEPSRVQKMRSELGFLIVASRGATKPMHKSITQLTGPGKKQRMVGGAGLGAAIAETGLVAKSLVASQYKGALFFALLTLLFAAIAVYGFNIPQQYKARKVVRKGLKNGMIVQIPGEITTAWHESLRAHGLAMPLHDADTLLLEQTTFLQRYALELEWVNNPVLKVSNRQGLIRLLSAQAEKCAKQVAEDRQVAAGQDEATVKALNEAVRRQLDTNALLPED